MKDLPDNYAFNVISERDLGDAAELVSVVFGCAPSFWMETFEHWWSKNPAWKPEIARGWIIRNARSQSVGFLANIPFQYVRRERPLLYCAASTIAVRDSERGKGLARLLARAASRQQCDIFVGTGSTPAAWRMWISEGLVELPFEWPQRAFFVIGNAGAFLDRALKFKNLNAGAATPLLTYGASIVERTTRRFFVPRKSGATVRQVDCFGRDDDSTFAGMRPSWAETYAVRSSKLLNWLYFGSETARKTRVVIGAWVGSALVGYISLRKFPTGTLFLLECRVHPNHESATADLLWAAQGYAAQNGHSHIVVHPFSSAVENALPRGLTVRAPPGTWFPFFYKPGATSEKLEAWETGPWDGDSLVIP